MRGFRTAGPVLLGLALLAAFPRSAPARPGAMRAPRPAPEQARREIAPETSTPALGLAGLVRFYRRRVSPLTSGRCGFSPSCSTYGLEALQRRGPLAGAAMIGDRLTRCNIFKGPRTYTLLPNGLLWDPLEDNLP